MRLAIWTASLMLALAGGAGPGPVEAPTRDVVVLASFPKELFEAYKAAFEGRTPGVRMVVKQQQANAAVTYLRETRARPEGDILWVSAVDAFQTLKADGLLDKVSPGKALLARIPPRIGSFPLHAPDGYYLGFAVSAYGLMWNTRYLTLHKLPVRREWAEIGRLPVVPTLYDRAPRGYPNPFTMTLGGVAFDDKLSSRARQR